MHFDRPFEIVVKYEFSVMQYGAGIAPGPDRSFVV